MAQLSSLPYEILVSHLIPRLDTAGIIYVVTTCQLEVDKDVYNRVFNDNTHFDHYGYELFLARLHSSLYIFGKSMSEELLVETGLYDSVKSIPHTMNYLSKLPSLGAPTLRICSGNGTIQAQNSENKVFSLLPYDAGKCSVIRVQTDVGDNDKQCFKEPCSLVVGSLLNRITAVDSNGQLWFWPYHSTENETAQPGVMVNAKTKEAIHSKVLSVRACGAYLAFLVEGTGLMLWEENEQRNFVEEHPKGQVRHANVIPFAEQFHSIKDFILTGSLAVVLNKDGTVQALNVRTIRDMSYSPSMYKDHKYPVYPLTEINRFGPFDQISSLGKQNFALVCQDGRILIASIDLRETSNVSKKITLIDDLKEQGVASVSVGPHHFLALTKAGDVYTWGADYFGTGCLGLGPLDMALKHDGVKMKGKLLVAEKPTKVDLPKKARAVFAGEYYSTVLI